MILLCLHRNIHSSFGISTAFHLCLDQVTLKYKDNDNKALLFLRFQNEPGGGLLAAHCPPFLPSGIGERILVRVCASSIRGTGTSLSTAIPYCFSWRSQTCLQHGQTGRQCKGALLASHTLSFSLLIPLPNPPPALSHSLHSSHRPLKHWACAAVHQLPDPLAQTCAMGFLATAVRGVGGPSPPTHCLLTQLKKICFHSLSTSALDSTTQPPPFFLMLSIYNNSVSIKSPPLIPRWSTLILSCKPDLTSGSLVFIWKRVWLLKQFSSHKQN